MIKLAEVKQRHEQNEKRKWSKFVRTNTNATAFMCLFYIFSFCLFFEMRRTFLKERLTGYFFLYKTDYKDILKAIRLFQ